MREIRDPRDVLVALFSLEDKLSGAPSVQGAIEDQLKQGTRVQASIDLTRAQCRAPASPSPTSARTAAELRDQVRELQGQVLQMQVDAVCAAAERVAHRRAG